MGNCLLITEFPILNSKFIKLWDYGDGNNDELKLSKGRLDRLIKDENFLCVFIYPFLPE